MGKPEGKIEKFLKAKAEENGFLCYKFIVPGKRGVPDRILMGYGHTFFVETKRESSGRLSEIQKARIKEMRAHGSTVYVCDSKDEVLNILAKYINKDISKNPSDNESLSKTKKEDT